MSPAPDPSGWTGRRIRRGPVRMVLRAALEAGVDVDAALAGTGVDAADIESGAQSLPFEVLYRLVKALPREGRDGAGLKIGARAPVTIHGAMAAAVSACESLGEALRTTAAMGGGPARILRFEFEVGPRFGDLTMVPDFDLGDIRLFVLEADAMLVMRLLEAAVGDAIPGLELHFPHPAPEWAQLYPQLLRGKVVFDADELRIRTPVAQLALRCVAADAAVREAALREWRREADEIEAATHADLAALIRGRLARAGETYPDLETVARSLALSPRTLIRRLRDKGLRYRQLVDEARAEVACWRLAHTEESVERIAAGLGYADPSNFSRTFRRWRGLTPGAYRRERRSGDEAPSARGRG